MRNFDMSSILAMAAIGSIALSPNMRHRIQAKAAEGPGLEAFSGDMLDMMDEDWDALFDSIRPKFESSVNWRLVQQMRCVVMRGEIYFIPTPDEEAYFESPVWKNALRSLWKISNSASLIDALVNMEKAHAKRLRRLERNKKNV